MEHYKKLLCLGDPILDIYIDDNGSVRHFNGGALNIYQNILALLEDKIFMDRQASNFSFAYPGEGSFNKTDFSQCYTICRTPLHTSGIAIADSQSKDMFYTPCGLQELVAEFRPDIMVLGDYNKGTINEFYEDITLPNIKYGVVDSRYRSLDLRWLETCQYKIWHATGSEYNEEWARNFDIVFWTNGPEDVKILLLGNEIGSVPVPKDTDVVDTCGSGDTFTATIAACLYEYDNIKKQSLIDYTKFAIQVCQSVVSQPYTSTTNKRIRRKCLLQT